MKIWRGLLGAAVLVCAVLCVTSVTVVADDGTHTHPICGATHTDIGGHTGECADVVWTVWDGTTDIDYGDSNTAYVYLTGNATPADMLEITSGKTLYLCLNGYSITSTDDGTSAFDAVITVYDEAQFVLCDCKNDTGTITHLSGMHGRGVRVGAGSKAAFTMYGGTISGNTADGNGGGIWLNSRLPISGSFSIINNTAVNGGGVYVKGPLTLSDNASITDNKATNGNGGGVYFSGSTFKISGGISITGNKKNSDANNIYLAKYKSISIVGELTGTTPIGITTEVTPDSSSYVRIASGNAEYAKPDKFQYENSNTPISVILNSSGSTATLVVCEHNWGTIWKTDTTSHWRECAICKGKNDIATHIGGTATCTEKAMCEVCDQLYGNVLGHDFTGDTWQSDADWHWKKCSRCEAIDEKAQHTGGTATCRDSAVCTTCSKSYGILNSGNHVGGAEIRGMTEATDEKAGYTGDSYCKGCNTKLSDGTTIPMISNLSVGMKSDLAAAVDAMDAYEAAKNAYDALSTDEKRMAGESTKTALDAMLKALTAYDVTYGNGSSWMENDNNTGLTFTVNGYHKKFADIVINGVVVDKKYYDIEVGSTIITLKAEYLQTLPAGKYTLLVQYTDGSTDGEDTFTITKNETTTSSNPTETATSSNSTETATPSNPTATFSPKTADNSKLGVWISIMLVSAGVSMILLQPFKKRK